jgi:hypothetical protein
LPESALRHIWLIYVVATFVNAAIWWWRGRKEIAANPELEPGYRRLIGWFLVVGNIPWLIIGAVFELPSEFSPTIGQSIKVFSVIVIIYSIAGFYWLFVAGGAEDLAAHPGLGRWSSRDPQTLKMQYLLIIIVAPLGLLAVLGLQYAFAPQIWRDFLAGLF